MMEDKKNTTQNSIFKQNIFEPTMEINLLYGIGFRLVLLDAEAKPVLEKHPFSYVVFLNRLSVLLHIEFGFQTEPSHKKSRQQ